MNTETVENEVVKEEPERTMGPASSSPNGPSKREDNVHLNGIDNVQSNKKAITPTKSTDNTSIWKNLMIISFGTMGAMASYDMLRYVETSLNSAEGLGAASLAANYTSLILSAMFIPTLLTKKIGSKWSLVGSMILFNFFSAAHFYPTFETLIPGALLMGIGYGLIHPCSNSYVTQLAHSYANLNGVEISKVVHYFFGIFLFIVFMARIWGNLVSSLVLTPSDGEATFNASLRTCGGYYCNEDLKTHKSYNASYGDNPDSPTSSKAYILYGTSIATDIASTILVAILLEDRRELKKVDGKEENACHHALATLRLMKQPKLLLVILITVFMGLIESYMSGDYTKAFVTCSLGIHHVGFVVICYGVCASVFSYIWGWMVKCTGRIPVFLLAALIDVVAVFAMVNWKPDPDQIVVFYVLSGVWGVADAVWRPQLYALYGFLFPDTKEAAFGNLEVWQSVGLVIGYVWHDYLCTYSKLYIMLVVLAAAMIGYLIVEYRLWSSNRKTKSEESNTHL
uniref:Protein unc-93 n=1 Tax=Hemiscolopendra marginata TaxID=943146 RepID=A0A646QJF0_9MYRI